MPRADLQITRSNPLGRPEGSQAFFEPLSQPPGGGRPAHVWNAKTMRLASLDESDLHTYLQKTTEPGARFPGNVVESPERVEASAEAPSGFLAFSRPT